VNTNNQSMLTEEDLANTVLADLKRVVREYTTAATESTCPAIRQMFTDLMNKTLTMQGQLFTAMKNCNMYETSSGVAKKEINKQIQSYKSTNEQTKNWLNGIQQQGNHMQSMNTGAQNAPQSSSTMH